MSIDLNRQQVRVSTENTSFTPEELTDEEVAAVVELMLEKMPPNAQRFHQVCSLESLEFSVRLYDSMD